MEFCVAYITCESEKEALSIGRVLVQKRLAACVNVLGGMKSVYWWENDVQTSQEVVLLAKTTRPRMAALIEEVKALHSYDTPCVIALPVIDGSPDYFNWLRDSLEATKSIETRK